MTCTDWLRLYDQPDLTYRDLHLLAKAQGYTWTLETIRQTRFKFRKSNDPRRGVLDVAVHDLIERGRANIAQWEARIQHLQNEIAEAMVAIDRTQHQLSVLLALQDGTLTTTPSGGGTDDPQHPVSSGPEPVVPPTR